MSNAEQRQWVVAVEDSVLQKNSEDSKIVFVKLRHPKTDDSCMILFRNNNREVYEVLAFKEKYSSWIIGQSVQQDGSLNMSTPVDPVFLVLPYLIKSSKGGKFMTLDQIVQDEEYPECQRLHDCSGLTQLDQVADVRGDDDFKAFRYNKDKTLGWLKQKVTRLCEVLEEKCVHVSGGSQVASFVRSTKCNPASQDDYLRYAHGIIGDYLTEELSTELKEHLGTKDVVEKAKVDEPPKKIIGLKVLDRKSKNEETAFKMKTENNGPVEDYSKNGVFTVQNNNKKVVKLTAAQSKLAKADRTGMKSISSFFSPRPKK